MEYHDFLVCSPTVRTTLGVFGFLSTMLGGYLQGATAVALVFLGLWLIVFSRLEHVTRYTRESK